MRVTAISQASRNCARNGGYLRIAADQRWLQTVIRFRAWRRAKRRFWAAESWTPLRGSPRADHPILASSLRGDRVGHMGCGPSPSPTVDGSVSGSVIVGQRARPIICLAPPGCAERLCWSHGEASLPAGTVFVPRRREALRWLCPPIQRAAGLPVRGHHGNCKRVPAASRWRIEAIWSRGSGMLRGTAC
jgi:hypothetical protein